MLTKLIDDQGNVNPVVLYLSVVEIDLLQGPPSQPLKGAIVYDPVNKRNVYAIHMAEGLGIEEMWYFSLEPEGNYSFLKNQILNED